jgi:DNA-binding HxlR family transcriptional regulator
MDADDLKTQFGEWSEMIRQIPDMQDAVKLCLARHLSSEKRGTQRHNELDELRAVMALFQQKYTFDIIFVLNGMGSTYFNDLRSHLDDINPTSLSKRLKELESEGFVRRTVQQGQPVRVSYDLTAKGNGTFHLLLPLLVYVKYADLFDSTDVKTIFTQE